MAKQLNIIYTIHSIDTFAGSLIGIFIPIYFLSLGHSLSQILVYYIVWSFGVLVFFFFAGYFSTYFGLKKTLIARLPFLFLYLLLLLNLKKVNIPLNLIALVSSLSVAFYWFPFNVLFGLCSDKEKIGNDVGKLNAIPRIFSLIAPLLGGLMLKFYGFNSLFVTCIFLYLFSALPILALTYFKSEIVLNINKLKDLLKKYPRYFLAETISSTGASAESTIWPIFIFLSFKDILSIGLVGTFFGIGGIFFSLFVGKRADKTNKNILINIGALIIILIWLLRYYLQGEIIYYILTVAAGFFMILVNVPFTSIIFSLAKRDNVDEFIIFREIPVMLGRVIIFSLCLILSNLQDSFLLVIGLYFLFVILFLGRRSLSNKYFNFNVLG